jgi:antirestriction protein
MAKRETPTNTDDVIDSRDVIAAIESGNLDPEEQAALEKLAEEGSGSPDWTYGETLIRDSHFEDYAQELAEETGMLKEAQDWPLRHIDWEAAADELKLDYMSVDFDGVDYWIRA